MDKYEYKIRSEEISELIDKEKYAEAAKVADVVDWRRVKSITMLLKIAALYRINRRNEDSRAVLQLAYDRYPANRSVVYSLCEVAIELDDVVAAIEYYKQFVKLAPRDNGVYTLRYRILEAQEASLEERIELLEELKKRDYQEEWAYELAYLYHRVGLATKCIEECDDIILWFGDGSYVMKAMELKMLHTSLTAVQQTKYVAMQNSPDGTYMDYEYNDSQQDNDSYDSYSEANYGTDTEYYSAQGYAEQGYTNEEYNGQGYVEQGYANEEYNGQGYAEQGYTNEEYNGQGYAEQGYANEEYNGQGYAEQGYANEEYNGQGYAEQGYTNEEYNGQGYAEQGYANEEYNGQGYAEQGYANEEYNGQGYVEQGYANEEYNGQGYAEQGYANEEYNGQGYVEQGYANEEYNGQGYAEQGYANEEYNGQGYAEQGYTNEEYNGQGYVEQGYANEEYNGQGYAEQGYANEEYNGQDYVEQGYANEEYNGQGYAEQGYANEEYNGQDYVEQGYANEEYNGQDYVEQGYVDNYQQESYRNSDATSYVEDMSQYNTINLQKVVAEGMKELQYIEESYFDNVNQDDSHGDNVSSENISDTNQIYDVVNDDAQNIEDDNSNDNLSWQDEQESIQGFVHTGKIALMEDGVSEENPLPNTGAIKKVILPGDNARIIKEESSIDEIRDITENAVYEEQTRIQDNDENVYHSDDYAAGEYTEYEKDDLRKDAFKPVTGQIKVDRVLAEWEKIKQENAQKHQEEIRQRVLQQTGKIFADFDNSVKSGILGELAEEEAQIAHITSAETKAENTEKGISVVEHIINELSEDAVQISEEEVREYEDNFLEADVTSNIPQDEIESVVSLEAESDIDNVIVTDEMAEVSEGNIAEFTNQEDDQYGEVEEIEDYIEMSEEMQDQEVIFEQSEDENTLSDAQEQIYEDTEYIEDHIYENAEYTEEQSYETDEYVEEHTEGQAYEYAENQVYETDEYAEDQVYETDEYAEDQVYETDKYAEDQVYETDEYAENQVYETDEYAEDQVYETDEYAENQVYEAGQYAENQVYEAGEYAEDQVYETDEYAENQMNEAEEYIEDLYEQDVQNNVSINVKDEKERQIDPEEAEIIAEIAKEDALKTQEIKMNTAELSSLSEKILATTKKETKGAKRDDIREFTPEEQSLFENFAVTKKIKKQILFALDKMTLAAYTGNVIITGEAGLDTVKMAKNLIKDYQATDANFSGKIAKITGEKINTRNIKEVFDKLSNGAIIIEKANGMNEDKLYEMAVVLNQENVGIIVIMEDTKKEITKLFEKQAMLADYFNIRIDLMEMDNNALVAYAKNYALALEYSIDELGVLALYTRIANIQSGNHVVTKDEVRDIIDEAIWKSKRFKIKNFVDILFARRYDSEDMIVLKERDFI